MSTRVFRHGELHLVVLHLLDGQPMHGYEIMKELGRLFGPRYRASAGSVYPAVEALEAEGLIAAHASGGRRVFSLTDVGREALSRRAEDLAGLQVRTGVRLGGNGVNASLGRFNSRVLAVAEHLDGEALDALLSATASRVERLADSSRDPHNESEPDHGQRPDRP